ncbi:MAG: glutamate--tRNA ligase [Desulfobacteraceae bacterium 4572_123]|nr:MAG: glutamate--tRNA ligase [Desulfobacteraceae bacterium 4572_123]
MKQIITRFPPSPTGYLHVGGARTALFNWLYARHTKGRFVLRIEDTDIERSTQASVDAIFEALQWLGIDWDEGPYFQSKRFDVYKKYVQRLIDSGHAYYCTCTPEEIEAMRKRGMAAAGKPRYDGTCRNRKLGPSDGAVVRFKAPQTGNTVIQDVVKGNIVFQNTDIDDFIIQRSDGTPMYNLAVVVDDITMQVNTIIRGDDHVSNTPKQILLYKAFGADVPVFGHVPMVLGNDRARLSKRHGATSVTAYRDMGFLPEAFLNYLVRLGWSHGDQEFFTLDELIEKFSLENIGHSAGVFDMEKLMALNADHIKAAPPEKLTGKLIPFLKNLGIEAEKGPYLESIIKTLNARSKTLVEMAEKARFYFQDVIEYDEKAARKVLKPIAVEPLKELLARFADMDAFTEPLLEDAFRAVMAKTGLKLGKIAQPVRVALTGRTASPGIFEIIEIIGKKKVMTRLEKAIDFIEEKNRE